MEHIANRASRRTSGWDRGRKLLSVTKLSAGGALIASSLVSVGGSLVQRPTSELVDVLVAVVGGLVTFTALVWSLHIFDAQD
jgi:hypothetical protein